MKTDLISRRSFLSVVGAVGAAAALTACGGAVSSTASSAASSSEAASSEAAGESVELIVFAAASLTETLNAIAQDYSAENPGVTFRFNFDSSGTLKTQIQEGADCDLFLSAGQKQMNQLDITASADVNTDGLDFVDPSTRVDLLENKVVLCVPEGSDKGIDSFDALAEHLKAQDILFCMGNSDVPVGQYTQKILAYYQLDEAALAAAGVITYGSNVKEVTTQISEDSVDAGVVYCTDAYSAGLTPVDEATAEMCGQIIYPAAVLKAAPNAEAAKEFLAYLQTDRAATVFEGVGFTAMKKVKIMDWYPLWNSLRIALISCAAVFFLGIFAAYYIAKLPRTVKGVLDVVLTLPMVLPPTVVGYFLLLLFGAKRPLGIFFMEHFGVKLVMNWYSAIFASIVVAFPLMYRTARGAFESFDETLAWSAQTLGQSNAWIFWRVRMPCCRQGILAGTVLAFARALGEYGATSMIAGYTPGKTATIATTVYQLWRTNDEAGAMRWVLVDIVISAVVLLAVNLLEKKQKAGGRA